MKKILLSLIAFIGAFSLLIGILIFPNLIVSTYPDTFVKRLDIVQDLDAYIEGPIEGGGFFARDIFYSTDTYKFLISLPDVEELEEILGHSVEDGQRYSISLYPSFSVLLNERFYGGFFAEFWSTVRLNDLLYANVFTNVEIVDGEAVYTDIYFYGYSSAFNSSNILKLFTWVIEAQEEAKNECPELQFPTYNAEGNEFNAIYNGFVFIGDIFEYFINYVKYIYAYIQIPLDIYFIN